MADIKLDWHAVDLVWAKAFAKAHVDPDGHLVPRQRKFTPGPEGEPAVERLPDKRKSPCLSGSRHAATAS